MKSIKLNTKDIVDFINAKNLPNTFATICSEKEASFSFEQDSLFFRFRTYDACIYDEIINQTKDWAIKVVRTEEWDPSIYATGKTVEEDVQGINPKTVLVKDNVFVGLIDFVNRGEYCEVSCVLLAEYFDEPLLYKTASGFGSSDHDMMYTIDYYLEKKN